MTPSLDIRPLTTADWQDFVELRLDGLRLHPEAFGTKVEAWEAATREQTEAALRDSEGPSDNRVLGAFAPDLAGMLGFKREARASVCHKATLWGYFVRPAAQRTGLGSALLAAALEHARDCADLDYVRAIVTSVNESALRRLAAHGFERYGLEAGGIRSGDAAHDQVYLRAEIV